jgi:chromate transport protein ChrA
MINKERIENLAIKLETIFAFMCMYLLCSKLLNWFKTLYVGNFNVFKSVISGVIAIGVFVFFIVTWKKTHKIARHFVTIFCCVCTYIHFDVLFAAWWVGTFFCIFAGMLVLFSIMTSMEKYKKKFSSNIECDDLDFFVCYSALFLIAQCAFWMVLYV